MIVRFAPTANDLDANNSNRGIPKFAREIARTRISSLSELRDSLVENQVELHFRGTSESANRGNSLVIFLHQSVRSSTENERERERVREIVRLC